MKKYAIFLIMACTLAFASLPLFAIVEENSNIAANIALATLEENIGGRLGVYAINTSDGQSIEYRANRRFPLCSTNKVMGVGAILKDSETDPDLLQKKIEYKKSDLVVWSPATAKHLHAGMTIDQLGRAAITLSDNTAINLLMKQVGGPKSVTAFARSIGDETFNLDRWEPELNTAIPGDLRDTSTAKAMANSLRKLVLGDALASKQRQLLKTWLIENTTGDARIRAGSPKAWVVGDKTGTCDYGTTSDVGVIWPQHHDPIVLVVYYTQDQMQAVPNDDAIALVAQIIVEAFSPA